MKPKLLCFVAFLLLCLSGRAETEPNNTLQQANNLAYNGNQSGSLTGTDIEDWFVTDLPQGGIFTLTVNKTGSGYAFLYLYDGETAGNPEIASINLPFGDSPAQGWAVSVPALGGKYYIKLLKTADPVNYQIGLSLIAPAYPEDIEPNDTVNKAGIVTAGGSISGTVHYYEAGKGYDMEDWYKLELPKGGILSLKIYKKGPGNTWIRFRDGEKPLFPELSAFYTGFSESPPEGWNWNFPALAGIYYFQVEGGGNVVDYKLDLALADPAFSEDNEPNDSITGALPMPVGGTVTGNVHYYSPGKGADLRDWYKLDVPKGGILNLTIEKKGPGNTWLYFLDGVKTSNPRISEFYFNFSESPAEGWKWSYPVLAGTYYFQFEGGEGVVDYKLEISLANPAYSEDSEPNDTISKAMRMPVNGSISGILHYYSAGNGIDARDWYKLEIPKGGMLNLKINKKGPGNTWFYFLDGIKTGNPRISEYYFNYSESPPEGWKWSYPVLAGTYYFQVDGGEGVVNYRMEISLDVPVWGEDTENNDSLRFAQKCTLNDSIAGLLGYYKPGQGTDNWDWFEINTTEFGYLSFHVVKKGIQNGNIRLRDTTVEINSHYLSFGDLETTWGRHVPAGTYYLGFEKFGGDIQYKIRMKFIPKPKADFTWTKGDNSFTFENTTIHGESYSWDFDDGQKETTVHPFHQYKAPGNYEVCLIAKNITGADTACQMLVIPGVNRIFPDNCGNEGEATIEIFGGGLDTTYDAKIMSGNSVLGVSAMTGFGGKTSILAIFDTLSIAPGIYDLVIEKPGGPSYKLPGGFTVMATSEAKPWIRIVGRNRILFNTWTTYTIIVGNSGNKDAHGVPLWIAISDLPGTEIEIDNINRKAFTDLLTENGWTLNLDSIPDFVSVDTVMGKPWKAKVYPLYIPFISAGSTNPIVVKVRTSQEIQFQAWLQPKYFNSGATDAVWCFISLLGREATGFVIDRFTAKGKCIFDILVRLYSLKGIIMRDPNGPRGISIIPWLWGWANTMAKCGLAFNEAIGILKHFADAVSKYSAMSTSLVDCLMAADAANMNITPANSLDPNEKTGPSGFAAENYVAGGRDFPYTIYFENKSTATAPAHTISITDQLDMVKFDLSTFSFGDIYIGDSLISVKPGLKQFAADKKLDKLKVVARVTGKLDTLTGKLEWQFRSLDPVTFADVEDPDLGVLPPNVVSPQGQGSVSFFVRLKDDPVHKAAVTNQASIVFDANPAIITNEHRTTFDLAAPESSVENLSATTTAREFTVRWTGTDDGSGIDGYNIYVSENDSAYRLWLSGTNETSAIFSSPADAIYRFTSQAVDNTGNLEPFSPTPDAVTQVVTAIEKPVLPERLITVSPVPAHRTLAVTIEVAGTYRFSVYGTDGRLLFEKRMNGSSVNYVTIPEGTHGLCLWKLVKEDGTIQKSGKLVIK